MTGKILGRPRLLHHQVIIPLLLGAGVAEIISAAILVGGVSRIRWATELAGDDVEAWVMASLRYRDSKTSAYRTSVVIFLVAMILFQAAASLTWLWL
jgi:hypothetical protein